ncbi:MAG TPA: FMN-binding negative transcriptional regulator [Vicinamibacterales bacterium]|nr:FMN-binding negative transcriptional regulator [Vicinamibacterales bacterium]
MYVPEHFKPDAAQVRELLLHHGAVDLITVTPDGLRATMLPMIYVEPDRAAGGDAPHGLLRGHFARKNDHWRQPVIGEAMAIVRGVDGYITPTWYATKKQHGRVVPTWNYITAHVYGPLTIHDDPGWVEANVRALTGKHEHGRTPRWGVDDAPAEYVTGQLRAIVGVELVIARIEAKFKLSQNRSLADIAGVVTGLEADARADMALAVRAANQHRER